MADSFYGRSHTFRRWLEDRGCAYALMVPKTHAVHYQERRQTAAKLVAQLPDEVWHEASTGMGVQGERRRWWACLPLSEACAPGMHRWLLVQHSPDDRDDCAILAYKD